MQVSSTPTSYIYAGVGGNMLVINLCCWCRSRMNHRTNVSVCSRILPSIFPFRPVYVFCSAFMMMVARPDFNCYVVRDE